MCTGVVCVCRCPVPGARKEKLEMLRRGLEVESGGRLHRFQTCVDKLLRIESQNLK